MKHLFNVKLNSKTAIFFLFLICIAGIIARIRHISDPLWLDEIISTWVIEDGFKELFTRSWVNNLSPLYFILLYPFKYFFGYSEAALRMPSLIAGILTIPLIYLITYKLSRSYLLALLAAFFTVITSDLIFYSQIVRPYSLVIFFSLLHLYIFLYFLEGKRIFLFAFLTGLSAGVAILIHYTAGVICVVEVLFALIYAYRNKNFNKQFITGLGIFFVTTSVVVIPILSHIEYLFQNREALSSYIVKDKVESVFTLNVHLIRYILLPFIVTYLLVYILKGSEVGKISPNNDFALFFLSFLYFIPLLMLWFLSTADIVNIYFLRYITWIIPLPIIGSMIILSFFHANWAKYTFLFFVLFSQFSGKIPSLPSLLNREPAKSANNITNSIDNMKRFEWKEIVTEINNSGLEPRKIYLLNILAESAIKNKSALFTSYLLSPVNSMYKLQNKYLEKAVPISSLSEIPDSASNYIVVLARDYNSLKHFNGSSVLGPDNQKLIIYYVKEKTRFYSRSGYNGASHLGTMDK